MTSFVKQSPSPTAGQAYLDTLAAVERAGHPSRKLQLPLGWIRHTSIHVVAWPRLE
jgi:hypothetical protein